MSLRLAIARTCMESISSLTRSAQKRAHAFLDKFVENPRSPGLNFERIRGARDPLLRSVRVDRNLRAIVSHPPKGDVYILLWIDNHDDAYSWASRYRCSVNPSTGVLQLYSVRELETEPQKATDSSLEPFAQGTPEGAASQIRERCSEPGQSQRAESEGLFGAYDQDVLLGLGVPQPLLPSVLAVQTEAELDALSDYLPGEAREALYYLACGYSPEEALEQLCSRVQTAPVDIEDFAAALDHPVSRAAFAEVAGREDLEKVLNAPLSQWRLFLHPSQERLVSRRSSGPVRVLGGAGTGKTVVLMHRAKALLSEVPPQGRILVTTFNRSLAFMLKEQLRALCGPEFSRLEVVNIHAWAYRFLQSQGVPFSVLPGEKKEQLFLQAYRDKEQLQRPLSFYLEEWERVVQEHGIADRADYLRVSRVGRGTTLTRVERAQIWEVFERYRRLLDEHGFHDWGDLTAMALRQLQDTPTFAPYSAVLVDEIQDFGSTELRLLRALVRPGPGDLFMVGDSFQRIYPRAGSLLSCGIDIRGRGRHLKVNYRTTQEIRRFAVAALQGAGCEGLEDDSETLKGYHSLRQGEPPTVELFGSSEEEVSSVLERVRRWNDEGVPLEHICLAARRTELVTFYRTKLEEAGLATTLIGNDGFTENDSGVRCATMHRMKGLEFPRVVLAGVSSRTLPFPRDDEFPDEASRQDYEKSERCLFYVAATRARDRLVVTGWGQPSPLICPLSGPHDRDRKRRGT